ncbi:MAG: hypothetical protein GXO71_07255 [Caldiserica bacterium]|nr:hypothetical protein [Caldisericota bacterium]
MNCGAKVVNRCFFIVLLLFLGLFPLYSAIVDRIVARVGDEVILLSEVEERMAPLLERLPSNLSAEERKKKIKELEKRVLENMIEEKLFLVEAKKKGYQVDDADVDREVERIKKGFPSEEDFFQALKEQGENISQLKEDIKEQLLIRYVIQREVLSKTRISEEEIKSFYEKYKNDLAPPPEVNISQILIKMSSEDVQEKIKEIEEKLKKGEDFYILARQYSEGPMAKEGGRIGFIRENQLLPEVRLQLKTMKVGEISPPVKCEDGYRFIKLEGVKESHVPSLKEVKGKIERILFRKKSQAALEKWIKEAKKRLVVEVNL